MTLIKIIEAPVVVVVIAVVTVLILLEILPEIDTHPLLGLSNSHLMLSNWNLIAVVL